MVNLGGSLAVATRTVFYGVSTDLNVSTSAGDKITAEVQCDKFRKTLAYTSIVFRNAAGETFARWSYTNYVV
jgi:acyl-coenzyme A thioesterase 13